MNQEVFWTEFIDENTLSDRLSSTNSAAQNFAATIFSLLKKGEKHIAVIGGFASCALVLQAGIDKDPSGKSETDSLIAIPLS